ncbi:hypothetical protein GCM10009712_32400 [Pseudarthrobacter sulfonivorans]
MEFHCQQAILDQLVEVEGGRTSRQPEGIGGVVAPDGAVRGGNQLEKLPAFFVTERGNGRHAAAPRKSAH